MRKPTGLWSRPTPGQQFTEEPHETGEYGEHQDIEDFGSVPKRSDIPSKELHQRGNNAPPPSEGWKRTVLTLLKPVSWFFTFKRAQTAPSDLSRFARDPALSFEWKRLFPLAVCCLGFGWAVFDFLLSDSWQYYIESETRWAVLPFAFLSCWIAIQGTMHFVRPKRRDWTKWILVAAFTAIIGIGLLLLVQHLGASFEVSNESFKRAFRLSRSGNKLIDYFKALFVWIAWCYGRVYDPDASFFGKLIGFVGGVGLCEESVKLLPVYLLMRSVPQENPSPKNTLSFRSVLMLALFSGMGFGISEAFSRQYCLSEYGDNQFLGAQLLRWFSCVPSHGVYTMIDASFLWMFRSHLSASKAEEKLNCFVYAVACAAVIHGVYDTLSGVPYLGMALDAASLALLCFIVKHAVRKTLRKRSPKEDPLLDFDPLTVRGKSFAKMYVVIAVGLVIWSNYILD